MEASEQSPAGFASWAIVELMGHVKIAGYVTVENLAGPMLRIDVPETENSQAFTKFVASASIYALTPCSEAVARRVAEIICTRPVAAFDLREPAQVVPRITQVVDEDDDSDEDFDGDGDGDDWRP